MCAKRYGFTYFGLQYGGHCRADYAANYDKHGASDLCESLRGGPLANDVFKITGNNLMNGNLTTVLLNTKL